LTWMILLKVNVSERSRMAATEKPIPRPAKKRDMAVL